MKLRSLLIAASLVFGALRSEAHDASTDMAQAAKNWLATLSPDQAAKARFEFKSEERTNWHFIPRPRKGLPIKEMTQEQRLLAHALLATGLSHKGYSKAVSIMSLETILAELEKARVNGPVRDPELYFVSIFGQPGGEQPWGWRVEGHHLALNFTVAGNDAPALTPSFFGTNPGEVRQGPRSGTRILAAEEELGRSLLKSLNDEQRKQAVLPIEVPKEILNDPTRAEPTKPEGLSHSQMNPEQRALLSKLVKEYLDRHRPDVASIEWDRIEKAGLDKVFFAWAGGPDRGQPHYYRVQGTSFVLEYDNTQNDANHVHAVWRDFAHDFGLDLLKAHYEQSHAK